MFMCRFVIPFVLLFASSLPAQEAWTTYRGNAQRTANSDGKAGPASPQLLWAAKSQDHFIASPVPVGDRVFLSGLGAFNVANFASYPMAAKSPVAPVWTKTVPFLKLPVVSAPVQVAEYLIFGDGMHQTSGATLYCIRADNGQPIWQLPVPGDLVHLEGTPTVAGPLLYIGGGAAGVICIEWQQASVDGKSYDLATLNTMQQAKWKELLAKYEDDKKKDPDFAVPPNEDQLLKALPKIVWQQGKDKWHVDAPVTVVGDRVIVASSFLDKEMVGDRAIHCLDAKTGAAKWRAPLKYNPWGGASASPAGDTLVVPGSSVGYYYTALKGAKGSLTALDIATGKEKWHKELPAGLVSCAALADGLAVVTATDGKVRAFALTDGERRWLYDAKMPIFARLRLPRESSTSVI